MFHVRQDGDHRNQVKESPIWEPEPPDPGEVHVGPQSQGPGDAQVATGFTSPGEAQVATSQTYRCGPAKDQNDQAQVNPKG